MCDHHDCTLPRSRERTPYPGALATRAKAGVVIKSSIAINVDANLGVMMHPGIVPRA